MQQDLGHWSFFREFSPEDWIGFVYQIEHVPSGRKYIGKKFFWRTNRKIVKNRKNRKRITKESDWKTYTGSSKWLNEDIKLLGIENFTFSILSLHESRSTLAFREVELLVKQDALRAKLADGTKQYYNGLIGPIRFIVGEETENEKQFKI